MRRLVLLMSIAIVVTFAHGSAAAAVRPLVVTRQTPKASLTPVVTANVALRVELQPTVVRLRERL